MGRESLTPDPAVSELGFFLIISIETFLAVDQCRRNILKEDMIFVQK